MENSSSTQPANFEIRFRGHLDDHRGRWFEGLSLTKRENGETLMIGFFPDQAALFGVLNRIRDLRLELVDVRQIHVD